MLNQHQLNLRSIDPHIQPLLNRVLQAERLGVCSGVITLDSTTSSCGNALADRFRLSIPYANQNLTWHILFDSRFPEMGPDFTFGDDTFLTNPDIDSLTNSVPSLAQWNPKDENALLKVLVELMLTYKNHQVQLFLERSDRLYMEYSTLLRETGIRKEDVEMILLPVGGKPTEARFLIRLDIDLGQLSFRNEQPQDYAAILLVTFQGPDWSRITPILQLSRSLEEAIGETSTLHIPPFGTDKCLMDYVPEVKRCISERIKFLFDSLEKRHMFITRLLLLQRLSVLEYDAVEFSRITLLLMQQDFLYLVYVHLPSNFPTEKPIVILQSIYHMVSPDKVYSETIDSYPYSPRWSMPDMVTKLLSHIRDSGIIQRFQTNSLKTISCDRNL